MTTKVSTNLQRSVCLCVIDGLLLGLFMVSVGVFGTLLYSPASPVYGMIEGDFTRGALMGLAMGVTAIVLIYSPWGGLTGAHMNPAVTLAFLRLGRIRLALALGYIASQFVFGLLGVVVIGMVIGDAFTQAPVEYASTVPGRWGVVAAFGAELIMTLCLMLSLLFVSNTKRLAAYTPVFAGAMIFVYITFEAPVSGMSVNPARTLASAIPSGRYTSLWVYFTAPALGMLSAAELFARISRVHCCKLNHLRREVCIHCGCDGPIDFDAHTDVPDALARVPETMNE